MQKKENSKVKEEIDFYEQILEEKDHSNQEEKEIETNSQF